MEIREILKTDIILLLGLYFKFSLKSSSHSIYPSHKQPLRKWSEVFLSCSGSGFCPVLGQHVVSEGVAEVETCLMSLWKHR